MIKDTTRPPLTGMRYLDWILQTADVRNPIEQPTSADWAIVERAFSIILPIDYKLLVSNLGSGRFGSVGLGLRNPASASPLGKFDPDSLVQYHRKLTALINPDVLTLFPNVNGFLEIGTTPFGCALFIQPPKKEDAPYNLCWFDFDDPAGPPAGRFRNLSVCELIHHLYLGLFREPWAEEARDLIWQDGSPFFVVRERE
jgi:hypothetical protein